MQSDEGTGIWRWWARKVVEITCDSSWTWKLWIWWLSKGVELIFALQDSEWTKNKWDSWYFGSVSRIILKDFTIQQNIDPKTVVHLQNNGQKLMPSQPQHLMQSYVQLHVRVDFVKTWNITEPPSRDVGSISITSLILQGKCSGTSSSCSFLDKSTWHLWFLKFLIKFSGATLHQLHQWKIARFVQ